MDQLIEQLERVRRRARRLLLLRAAAHGLSVLLAAAMAAGLLDYLLRLPGGLRLGLLLIGAAAALIAAGRRWWQLVHLRPALTSLALRLERMYPMAAGRLASGVAFATEPGNYEASPTGRRLARHTTEQANRAVPPEHVRRLIDPRSAWRAAGLLALTVLVAGGAAAASPDRASIAFRRWTNPLGEARWPNRYHVENETHRRVAPNDTPVKLTARVTKGELAGLRTWAVYRFEGGGAGGDWQRTLMTRQGDAARGGVFQRPVEPRADADRLTFYFEAGDDRSAPRTIRLIEPPTLTGLTAEIAPPEYAEGLVAPRKSYLLKPPRPSVTLDALAGSRITLTATVTGSFDAPPKRTGEALRGWLRTSMPGLLPDNGDAPAGMDLSVRRPAEGSGQRFTLGWTLHRPTAFRFHLRDAHGGSYEDQRRFAFELREDQPPQATVLEPSTDRSVLPTAKVSLKAEARDDVAVRRLRLVTRTTKRQQPDEGSGGSAQREPTQRTVAAREKLQPRCSVEAELDLSPRDLQPGDEVAVVAIAEDNYELAGDRHEPVTSTARTLRIISEQEMSRQLRAELASVRQRAVRARNRQNRLREAEPNAGTARKQSEVAEQLTSMRRTVRQVRKRAERNRLSDEAITETIEDAGRMLEQGRDAAASAADRLGSVAQDPQRKKEQTKQQLNEARREQERTSERLKQLVRLLDQGRDAYELRQKLVKLSKDHEAASDKTRQTLPKTLGQERDELPEQQKQKLDELSETERQLSEEAQQLVERMRSTAGALSRQSERPQDQALAEALKKAADAAEREALERELKEASKKLKANRLSQAQQRQQRARQALQQMLAEMGRVEQLRQQILRRRLLKLVESIRQLRDQQRAQLKRLRAAETLGGLDEPLLTLRRNTLAVADQARSTGSKGGTIADPLEAAAEHQGRAVRALRAEQTERNRVETAESDALAELEEALKQAKKLQQKAQNQQRQQKRRELIQAYEKALQRQRELLKRTRKLDEKPETDRDRRWRAEVMKAGKAQKELRGRLDELSGRVSQTVVYQSVHEQIDGWAADAAEQLRNGKPGEPTRFNQRMIVSSIESLIEALKPDQKDEDFATGSGGGGQGGGKPRLIPPRAELKLLRARQKQLHTATRRLADQSDGDGEQRRRMLDRLGRQQSQLAETGRKLIQRMQRQRQQRQQQKNLK